MRMHAPSTRRATVVVACGISLVMVRDVNAVDDTVGPSYEDILTAAEHLDIHTVDHESGRFQDAVAELVADTREIGGQLQRLADVREGVQLLTTVEAVSELRESIRLQQAKLVWHRNDGLLHDDWRLYGNRMPLGEAGQQQKARLTEIRELFRPLVQLRVSDLGVDDPTASASIVERMQQTLSFDKKPGT